MFKNKNSKNTNSGFTMIEIMMVTVLITILLSGILFATSKAKERTLTSRTRAEMRDIADAMIFAKNESGKYLYQIDYDDPDNKAIDYANASSESKCFTEGSGATGDLRNTTGVCYKIWLAILKNVQEAANGAYPDMTRFQRDPWGSPYTVEENDGVHGSWCGVDYIRSVGSDGKLGVPSPAGNDIAILLPFDSLGRTFPVYDNYIFGINGPVIKPVSYNLGRTCTCQSPARVGVNPATGKLYPYDDGCIEN